MDGWYDPGWNCIDPQDRRWLHAAQVARDYKIGFHAYTTPVAIWNAVVIPVWLAGIVATGFQGGEPVAVAEAMYIDPEVYRAAVAGDYENPLQRTDARA